MAKKHKPEKKPQRREYWHWVRLDNDGRVRGTLVTRDDMKEEGWRRLTREEADTIMWLPEAYLITSEGIIKRQELRFSVTKEKILASEKIGDFAEIMVDGDELGDNDPVFVSINGDRVSTERLNPIMLKSHKPGQFEVELDDIRYFSHTPRHIVMAVEPETEQEDPPNGG